MENSIIKSWKFEKAENDSNEHYHSQDSISASGLKQLKKSPAHYKYEGFAQTDAMFFGEAYHTFILENERFYQDYTVVDPSKRPDQKHGMTAKANQAWLSTFSNPISADMHIRLKAMRDRLFKHPYAKSLLTNGEVEHSYYGELDIGSEKPVNIRFRPDNVKHDKRIIVDLKTAQDASMDKFPSAAAKFDYQIQAAFYSDMMEMHMNEPMGYRFFFVAQEKTKPFAFNIFEASAQFLSVGRYEYETLLMMYAYCLENDRWPGYQIFCHNKYGVNELSLPPWAIKELEYFTNRPFN